MIEVEDLHVSYGRHQVLNGVSLSLETGRVHGIAGLNGAGKTTLLDTIFGYIRPDRGKVNWNGSAPGRGMMGYLETNSYFYPDITGREYLSIFKGNADFREKDWEALACLPLDKRIDSYSTGMKKKLALLAQMKLDRQVLIMDEPFNGLDLESVKLFGIVIDRLREKGRTIIITSHILETLTRHCDQIAWLEDGKVSEIIDRNRFHLAEDIFLKAYSDKTKELVADMIR